jgi:hypothetical protein
MSLTANGHEWTRINTNGKANHRFFSFLRPFAVPFLRSLRPCPRSKRGDGTKSAFLLLAIGCWLFSQGLTPTSSKWINKSAGS